MTVARVIYASLISVELGPVLTHAPTTFAIMPMKFVPPKMVDHSANAWRATSGILNLLPVNSQPSRTVQRIKTAHPQRHADLMVSVSSDVLPSVPL